MGLCSGGPYPLRQWAGYHSMCLSSALNATEQGRLSHDDWSALSTYVYTILTPHAIHQAALPRTSRPLLALMRLSLIVHLELSFAVSWARTYWKPAVGPIYTSQRNPEVRQPCARLDSRRVANATGRHRIGVAWTGRWPAVGARRESPPSKRSPPLGATTLARPARLTRRRAPPRGRRERPPGPRGTRRPWPLCTLHRR